MVKKTLKRFVIDASVARAAGTTDHPRSKVCRELLQKVLDICHRMVKSAEISREWKEHSSKFAAKWLSTMTSRKKAIHPGQVDDKSLRSEIEKFAADEKSRKIMLNDVHLIEAALKVDRIIISLDQEARNLFNTSAKKVKRLKQVLWINPEKADAVEWLRKGATLRSELKLGFISIE